MRFPRLSRLALVLFLAPACGRSLVEFPNPDGGAKDAALLDGQPSDTAPTVDTRDALPLDTRLDTAITSDAHDTALATDTRDANAVDAADAAADTAVTDALRSDTGDTSDTPDTAIPNSDSRDR